MENARLERQMAFLIEMERLKTVYRQNGVIDRSRCENSAEHSWHVALMALVLHEHALTPDLDAFKIIKMLLLHDVVEIDAGDTWLFDEQGHGDKAERETSAAGRLFGLLPPEQAECLAVLWREFEAGESPEARFARALDNMQAVVNHRVALGSPGDARMLHVDEVYEKKRFIEAVSPALWAFTRETIRESGELGLYETGDETRQNLP